MKCFISTAVAFFCWQMQFAHQPTAAYSTTLNALKSFEGIIYAKTSFPGHPYDEILKQIDFTKGNIAEQFNALKHQPHAEMDKAAAIDPESPGSRMYRMALALMPVRTTTIFTADKSFIQMTSLGYEWQVLIDEKENKGRMFLQSHNMQERGIINFQKSELRKIWEKEQAGEYEGEYTIKSVSETTTIAGFPCKKMVYVFSGTSQGQSPMSKIIATIPWKITVWYSDAVDPRINIQHPMYIKLNKAILKTEVEFDKAGKKKMLYEVTKIEPKKIDDEAIKIPELGEVVNHQPGGQEALMLVMKVMTEAGKISWQ